jgi:hypothetical protein
MGDLEQAGRTDRCGVAAVVDRELDGFGLALRAPLDVLLHPLLLALRGGDAHAVEAAPHLELVHPAGIGSGEVPPEGSQRNLLADDDEVRLVAVHAGIVSSPRACAASHPDLRARANPGTSTSFMVGTDQPPWWPPA